MLKNKNDTYKSKAEIKQNIVLDKALKMIEDGENGQPISCIIIKDNVIIHTAYGRGVSPLLNVFTGDSDKMKDAFVVDKIIGKAAAMILVSGGAKRVYGTIMSVSGREYLQKHGIIAEYTECVDMISNRDGTDMCPIEKSVIDIDDSFEGLKIIGVTIDNLKKAANSI